MTTRLHPCKHSAAVGSFTIGAGLVDASADGVATVRIWQANIGKKNLSRGQLHYAMTGTGAVAIAAAAEIPGTLVHRTAAAGADGRVPFGHPSRSLSVGARAIGECGQWLVRKVLCWQFLSERCRSRS